MSIRLFHSSILLFYTLLFVLCFCLYCERSVDSILDGDFIRPGPEFSILGSNPSSNGVLGFERPIIINFSLPVDIQSLNLSGSLAVQSKDPIWTGNDFVLTLHPQTVWSGGTQDLVLSCSSENGDLLHQQTLTFTVDDDLPNYTTHPLFGDFSNNPQQPIQLFFDESMDRESLNISQFLSEAVGTIEWSEDNTSVTFLPETQWVEANNQVLITKVKDIAGNPAEAIMLILTFDYTSPEMININFNGGSSINGDQSIRIVFNENVFAESIEVQGSIVENRSFYKELSETTYSQDTLTIKPESQWNIGENQTLIVSGTDYAGNTINLSLEYEVVSVYPEVSNINPEPESWIINSTQPIIISFSKEMDPASLTLQHRMTSGTLSTVWNSPDNNEVTITPDTVWEKESSNYLIIGCEDLTGNSLVPTEEVLITYNIDLSPPSLVAILPSDGSNIETDTLITVQFDEYMNQESLILGGDLGPLSNEAEWYQGNTKLVLNPMSSWVTGENKELYLYAEDLSGQTFVESNIITYTIRCQKDILENGIAIPSPTTTSDIVASENNVYISYYVDTPLNKKLVFGMSNDLGNNWNHFPVDTNGNTGEYNSIDCLRQSEEDILYIAYSASRFIGLTNLYLAISDDIENGRWELIEVNGAAGTGFNNDIAVEEDGGNIHIYISYIDNQLSNYKLMVSTSSDNGSNWNNHIIDNLDVVNRGTSIKADNGTVYLAYVKANITESQIYFIKGENYGTDWSSGPRLVENNLNLTLTDYPSLDILTSENTISIGYCSNNELHFAKSVNGGEDWNVSSIHSSTEEIHYSSLATPNSENFLMTFYDDNPQVLRCAFSDDQGSTWDFVIVDFTAQTGKHSALYATNESAFVSYSDYTNSTLKFSRSDDLGLWWTW